MSDLMDYAEAADNFEMALFAVLTRRKEGFAGRSTLWKARAAARAHLEFERSQFDQIILQVNQAAGQS